MVVVTTILLQVVVTCLINLFDDNDNDNLICYLNVQNKFKVEGIFLKKMLIELIN